MSLTTEPESAPQGSNCASSSSSEVVVVGRSCGQQKSDGSYSGHVTVLALGGNELLGEDSSPSGTTATGSFAPLLGPALTQLNGGLAQLCSGSSNNVCLSLLNASSSTTSSGSTNSFTAASADLGGSSGISASALSSSGNISQTSTCQTASGSSQAANVTAGGTNIADLASSNDSSTACQNASQNSQTHSSDVLGGQIAQLTSPILGPDCAGGNFSQPLSQLPAQLAQLYCNAFDSDGSQASAPYGTSEGLTAILLGGLGLHAAASESLATAPGTAPFTSPGTGNGSNGTELTSAVGTPSTASANQLAFTGINLALELIVAFALLVAGTAAWLASRRRSGLTQQ